MNNQNLPIFLKSERVCRIIQDVIDSVPQSSEAYLVGGAIRNAVYYRLFEEELPQRDYDIILIGDKDLFVSNLFERGFVYGKKNMETGATFKKPKVENPSENFDDWVYLDVTFEKDITIQEVLDKKVNFTINGSAISLREIGSSDWFEKLITIPEALEDLRSKRLVRRNIDYPTNIYACVRFVYAGFSPPPNSQLNDMLNDARKIEEKKFNYNRDKIIRYVGSAEKVREIVKQLGLDVDILDWNSVRGYGSL